MNWLTDSAWMQSPLARAIALVALASLNVASADYNAGHVTWGTLISALIAGIIAFKAFTTDPNGTVPKDIPKPSSPTPTLPVIVAVIALFLFASPSMAQVPAKATPTSLFGIAEQRQIMQLQQQIANAHSQQIAAMQAQLQAQVAQNQLLMSALMQQRNTPAPTPAPSPPAQPPIIYILPSPGGPPAPLPSPGPVAPLPSPGPVAPLPIPGPVAPLPSPGPIAPLPSPGPIAPLPTPSPSPLLPSPGPIAPAPLAPTPSPNPGPQVAPLPSPGGPVAPLPSPVGPPVGYQRYTEGRPPVISATATDRFGNVRAIPQTPWTPLVRK